MQTLNNTLLVKYGVKKDQLRTVDWWVIRFILLGVALVPLGSMFTLRYVSVNTDLFQGEEFPLAPVQVSVFITIASLVAWALSHPLEVMESIRYKKHVRPFQVTDELSDMIDRAVIAAEGSDYPEELSDHVREVIVASGRATRSCSTADQAKYDAKLKSIEDIVLETERLADEERRVS